MGRVQFRITEPVTAGALAFDLGDILKALSPVGSQFDWSVLHIQATGAVESGSMLEFEKRVEDDPTGVRLSWAELVRLAGGIDQTINCLVVGNRPREDWPDRGDRKAIAASDVVIEAVDSSYWQISTTTAAVAKHLRDAFHTEEVRD